MITPLSSIQHQLIKLHSSIHPQVIRLDLENLVENCSENYETTKHYVCTCPYCVEQYGYEKLKLYVDKENLDKGFCQHCKTAYFNYTTDLDFGVVFKKNKISEFKLCKLHSSNVNVGGKDNSLGAYLNCVKDEVGILSLLSERNLSSSSTLRPIVKERNIERYKPLIEKLGIRGTRISESQGFIMVPFYINNELIYWQTKLVGYKLKYYMPPIAHKPLYIPEFRGNKVVIVEGIFDAIACLYLYPERTPIAILGSYLTDYHIWLLRRYIQPTDCLISLDNIHLSIAVMFQLRGLVPTITSYDCYFGQYDQDPDELLSSLSNEELEKFKSTHNYVHKFEWE